jgi:acyl-CoA thioesterase-1
MSSRGKSRGRSRSNKRSPLKRWLSLGGVGLLAICALFLAGAALGNTNGPDQSEIAAAQSQLDARQAEAQAAEDAEDAAAEAAAFAAAHTQVTRPADRPMRVLYAGDSLTYGLFSSVPELAFRPLVTAELAKGGEIEESRGERSGAGAGAVGNLVTVPDQLDLAIVELGTNDTGGRTEIGLFEQQYNTLMAKIMDPSPNSGLVCVGTWGQPGPGTGTDAYDDVIEKVCTTFGGIYVDASDTFTNTENRGPAGLATWGGESDTFHPNDAGHRALADLVLGAITVS